MRFSVEVIAKHDERQQGKSVQLSAFIFNPYLLCLINQAHVLAHFVKSFRAYNVKLSSTLFSGNIQSNFKISFPNARFFFPKIPHPAWLQLDYQESHFSDPCII